MKSEFVQLPTWTSAVIESVTKSYAELVMTAGVLQQLKSISVMPNCTYS